MYLDFWANSLHSLRMPNFRAINQPPESTPEPTAGARQLPETMPRPEYEVKRAHPSVIVPLRNKTSNGHPEHEGDLRQAAPEAKKDQEKPKKKKRSSASGTSKPRRQQADRETKLMYSIETGSARSDSGNDRSDDSDFVPSKADQAEISMSSASNTPSRRSPRKHPSKYRYAGLSPQTSPESSPPMALGMTARPPSPSLSSSRLRRKLYKRDEFVELPRDVYERKEEKRIKKAEEQKEKEEANEQRPSEETYRSRRKRDKRKTEDQSEHDKPRKRKKSEKLGKPRPEDIAYDGRDLSEVPQKSKQESPRWSSKGKTTEEHVQPSSQASAKAQNFPSRVDKPGDKPSKHRWRKKRVPKQDCRESLKRREVAVPESLRPCTCSDLPDYFRSDPSFVPRLQDWPVGRLEFFEHIKQISTCRGSNHLPRVVRACRRLLEEHNYPEHFPSMSSRNDFNPRRAQSSIPPPVFYGKRRGYRPDHSTESSVHQPRQNGNNECSPSKSLPIRTPIHGVPSIGQSSKSDNIKKSNNHVIPSNPSPLGQRRRFEEDVGVKRIPKALPEASSVLDPPYCSFKSHRRRHQSMPVNVLSTSTNGNERDLVLPSAPQWNDNALREISNNAILQRVDKLEKLQRAILERLPATAPTQTAVPGPVSAPSPIIATATATQAGHGIDPAPAGSERQDPPQAERQPKRPRLNRHVPAHRRLNDEQIIEIGRIVARHERHEKAPQAFDQRGRFYAEYKRLLSRTDDGGGLVWTPDEIRRLTR